MTLSTVSARVTFRRFAQSVIAMAIGLFATHAPTSAEGKGAEKGTSRMIETGITLPADLKPRELRFKTLGLIKTVNVKEGDEVKAGQVLMAQDDTEELAELDVRTKDATEIRIKGAEISSRAKQAELKRIKIIHDQDAHNDAEFEKAQAEAELAELNIFQEKQELEIKKAKVVQQQKVVDRMTMHSPIDGIVQAVDAHVGEMVDPSKPAVVTIVNNTPLVVEVFVPTVIRLQLKLNQMLRVSYDEKDWKEAKVSFLPPMADASSNVQKIHLTTPNAEAKASGFQIFVELPQVEVAKQ